jgi:hypothetical protein
MEGVGRRRYHVAVRGSRLAARSALKMDASGTLIREWWAIMHGLRSGAPSQTGLTPVVDARRQCVAADD